MDNLGAQAVRGTTITLGAQAAKFALSVGITMILARLLTPTDYGLVAMAALFSGLLAVFRDGGLSVATVQSAAISAAQLSTLFWLNTALGITLALGMAAISPLVGSFYEEDALIGIALALSVPFITNGLGAQPQALLQRRMQFSTIAVIDVVSLIVSSASGIGMALAGLGYWALVAMLIVSSGTNSLLSFLLCRWRPAPPSRGSDVGSMLRFGGAVTLGKLIDTAGSSFDSLILGKFFNAAVVGTYTRAQSLMLLPSSQIVPPLLSVFLPILSRLNETPSRLRQLFGELLCLTILAASFVSSILVVASDWLTGVMLGPQWTAVPTILSLLAGPALFVPLSAICVVGITALGDGKALIHWAFYKNAATAAAIVVGAPWGGEGIALSLSIVTFTLLMPILNNLCARSGLVERAAIWRITGIGIGVNITCIIFLFWARLLFTMSSDVANLAIFLLLSAWLHAVALWCWPLARRAALRALRSVFSRASGSA